MGKGRAPCCDKSKVKKGPWTPAEDSALTAFIHSHGHSNWRALPKLAGLMRCGKSCRLRWINYLSPDVKRGNFTPQEDLTIINLHNSFGNKWSKIASYLPGRTDNEIKNVWNTRLKKRLANNNLAFQPNRHGTEPKDSPSCTSSSITDQKIENALGEKPDSLIKVPENSSSDDSPTSAHHASDPSDRPNKAVESSVINPVEDGGNFGISPDDDFWEMFDSLPEEGPSRSAKTAVNTEECFIDDPAEKVEWFRFLEDELGLTSCDVDKNIVQTNPQDKEEMNLEQPAEMGPGFDYFPTWPSSPQNLGIS